MKKTLVIISGLPASGKTTLARHLAQKYNLPLLIRDEFKELIGDEIGLFDKEWSTKLGRASWSILWKNTDILLKTGGPFIVESNFNPAFDSAIVKSLASNHDYKILEINCHCDGKILFDRFVSRTTSKDRHKIHCDNDPKFLEELKHHLYQGKIPHLNIEDSHKHSFDSSNLENISYSDIENLLEVYL